MRQRTKVGEHWIIEWRDANGVVVERSEPIYDLDIARCEREDCDQVDPDGGTTCHVVKVTRYRLAPLVVLPAWDERAPNTWVVHGRPEHAVFCEVALSVNGLYAMGVDTDMIHDQTSYFDTADEARAACEKRLRELGYRVAKVST